MHFEWLFAAAQRGVPLLLSSDDEGGRMMNYPGVHSAWPNLMAVGATDDAFVAQDYAVNYGVELRGVGLNMVLSPCGARGVRGSVCMCVCM